VYFFDCALVRGDDGKIFENLVAISLYRELELWEDGDGRSRSLRYLRTKEGLEVDFVLTEEEKMILIMEARYGDRNIAHGLQYFNDRYGVPGVQLVADLRAEDLSGSIALRRAMDWLERPDEWVP
jgi:predicted AAA+ superfamily ATPase